MSELASESMVEPMREALAERQRGRALSELASESVVGPMRDALAERSEAMR